MKRQPGERARGVAELGCMRQEFPMTDAKKLWYLRAALVVIGVACVSLLPISKLWPAGFAWHPEGTRSYYFEMICVIYFSMGCFSSSRQEIR